MGTNPFKVRDYLALGLIVTICYKVLNFSGQLLSNCNIVKEFVVFTRKKNFSDYELLTIKKLDFLAVSRCSKVQQMNLT